MVEQNKICEKQVLITCSSIAFNLTLSKRMIDMLVAVRDYGFS